MLSSVRRSTLVQLVAGAALVAVVAAAVVVAWPRHHAPGVAAAASQSVAQRTQTQPSPFKGAPVPHGVTAPGFRLADQTGRPLRLASERGKLVLITFLFTRCTDICPLIAIGLDSIVRDLGKNAQSVDVLAISVDPKGDTQAAVREYIRSHRLGPEFHWLIGKRTELYPVWRAYNVGVSGEDTDVIAHTAPVLLLDRTGRPRVYYQQPMSRPAIAHDLHVLLRSHE
jgi:protein SCO1